MSRARVVIVGAGVVGLAVAEELSRVAKFEVELLERNAAPGQESSWAAAGILSPQGEAKGRGAFLELLLAGFQLIPETVQRLQAVTGVDCAYRASGMLMVAFTARDEEELTREMLWQQEAGLSVEKVSPEQIRKREPLLDGPARWGLWSSQTVQFDNTRFVEAYRKAVLSQGAIIRTNTPVTRFLVHGDRVTGVETPHGPVEADWVIDCAGAWAGFDERLPFSIPTVPVRGQMLQFRTDRPWFGSVVRSPRAYLVQRYPNVLIAGTTVEYDAGYEKEVTPEGRRSIREGAQELTSRLANHPPERCWAGLRPGTPDGMPILGPTPLKGLLIAAGHFRNGVLLAPLTGRLMADWILEGSSSLDLAPFRLERFLAKTATY